MEPRSSIPPFPTLSSNSRRSWTIKPACATNLELTMTSARSTQIVRVFLGFLAVLLLAAASALLAEDKSTPPAIPLWPHDAPGSEGRSASEKVMGTKERHVSSIHKPSLTPFLPPKGKA